MLVYPAFRLHSVSSARFGGKENESCPSKPPSRPLSPLPPSRHESLPELTRKADYWKEEIEQHREKAEAHLLTFLMTGDRQEDTLTEKHNVYVRKCEQWYDDVVRELRRKLNMPQHHSPLCWELKLDKQ